MLGVAGCERTAGPPLVDTELLGDAWSLAADLGGFSSSADTGRDDYVSGLFFRRM